MSDAEGLLGFVDLSRLHLFHSGRNDLFFYAQQTNIKITLAYRLPLQKDTKTQSFKICMQENDVRTVAGEYSTIRKHCRANIKSSHIENISI